MTAPARDPADVATIARLTRTVSVLERAQSVAHIGSWEFDPSTVLIHASDEGCRIFDAPPGAPFPRVDALRRTHPDDRARVLAAWQAMMEGAPYDIEHRIVTATGEKWVHARAQFEPAAEGRPPMCVGTIQDVTEAKRLEEELNRHRHQLQQLVHQQTDEMTAILDALPDLYFRLDLDGRILDHRANRSDDLYVAPAVFLGRRMQDVLPPEIAELLQRALLRVHADQSMVSVEYELPLADGPRAFEARIRPLGDQQLIVLARDVTERRQAERALSAARDAAEAASRAKSAFVANMSHELRTPMNAIIGLTHLMSRDTATPQQQQQIEKIATAARNLLGIINDILDFSKIESGKLQLENVDFALDQVIDDVRAMMIDASEQKGLALTIDVSGVPRTLRGDGLRLGQVLLNLTSNAVKFTERGMISIVGRVVAREGARIRARFEVRDTGIGLTPAQQERLFRPFEQADTSTTRKYGGTGLGLVICQRIVELMGGRIGVDSSAEQGATFWFEVPLEQTAGVPRMLSMRPPGAAPAGNNAPPKTPPGGISDAEAALARRVGARLLVAEDDELNQEVAVALLRQVGLQVDLASNGVQAVEMARKQRYDLILMDVQMPELDGLDATRRIRVLADREQTPIVAMTASAFETDREACAAAGMNDYVPKPVVPNQLYSVLLRWLPASAPETAALVAAARGVPDLIGLAMPGDVRDRLSSIPGLDVDAGLRTMRGELSSYARLLEQFCARHDADAAKLEERLGASDREGARLVAHSLKGVAGNLGLRSIQALAAKIETAILRKAGQDDLRDDTAQLADELTRTVQGLRSSLPARAMPAAPLIVDRASLQREVAELRALLANDDALATEVYQGLRAKLEAAHGPSARRLTQLMEQFNYAEALLALDALS